METEERSKQNESHTFRLEEKDTYIGAHGEVVLHQVSKLAAHIEFGGAKTTKKGGGFLAEKSLEEDRSHFSLTNN
jgi:hypothetical protein